MAGSTSFLHPGQRDQLSVKISAISYAIESELFPVTDKENDGPSASVAEPFREKMIPFSANHFPLFRRFEKLTSSSSFEMTSLRTATVSQFSFGMDQRYTAL
jgi:hypothetical protein